jgi:hypothetical protein
MSEASQSLKPEKKFDFNRCVTVNFSNQSTRTLSKTSGDFETEWGLHNVQAPTTIYPQELVTWDQKSDFTDNLVASASYSFSQDDGTTANILVAWNNSKGESNSYTVSCDAPDLFAISYTGGSGDESTIYVLFYECAYNYPDSFWYQISYETQGVLSASSANTIGLAEIDLTRADTSQQWAMVDPKTSIVLNWNNVGDAVIFKLFNRKYKGFLVASGWQNNNVILYVGNDGQDQYWNVNTEVNSPRWSFVNENCKLALIASSTGGLAMVPLEQDTSGWVLGY